MILVDGIAFLEEEAGDGPEDPITPLSTWKQWRLRNPCKKCLVNVMCTRVCDDSHGFMLFKGFIHDAIWFIKGIRLQIVLFFVSAITLLVLLS